MNNTTNELLSRLGQGPRVGRGEVTIKSGKDYVAGKVHALDFEGLINVFNDCMLHKILKNEEVLQRFDTFTHGEYTTVFKNSIQFLNVATTVFGAVKPDPTYDVVETLKLVEKNPVDILGYVWDVNKVKAMAAFFVKIPFGLIADITQTKSKLYNAAVPIFMLGQKLYNDIPYNKWKKDPLTIRWGTSKIIYDASDWYYDMYPSFGGRFEEWVFNSGEETDDDVSGLRAATVTGKGGRYSFTGYRANNVTASFMAQFGIPPEGGEGVSRLGLPSVCNYNAVSKIVRMMILQLWIFNASCRNEHMIMDLEDWSKMPQSLDPKLSNFTDNGEAGELPF
jgi:hypothetical protein